MYATGRTTKCQGRAALTYQTVSRLDAQSINQSYLTLLNGRYPITRSWKTQSTSYPPELWHDRGHLAYRFLPEAVEHFG